MMLSAERLTRRFGTRVAVDEVSLSLAPGEVVALLGPNGAGKTTTLRMLAGLVAPSSGTVRIGSETLSPQNASRLRAHVGFLTEAPGLWERLSVERNLLVYARLYGVPEPEAAVARSLDLLNLRDRRRDRTAHLSKGLRQRVALVRALLHQPPIVLLDEPTAGLDPESARDVRDLISRLRAEGRTVLLSTHNLDEVVRVADRVAVLRSRLVAVDTPAALRTRMFGTRVQVVTSQPGETFVKGLADAGFHDVRCEGRTLSIAAPSPDTAAPRIVRQLVEAGADIERVTAEEASLEDVYLRLIGDGGGQS